MDVGTDQNPVQWLLESDNYREFILRSLTLQAPRGSRVNFAQFSRKAGFASRSFPRDVVAGKRRITAASLPRFVRGLKLRGDWKTFFELLVGLEDPEAVVGNFDPNAIAVKTKLEKVKAKLSDAQNAQVTNEGAAKLFSSYYRWLEIYAVLGEPNVGATLEEICHKTRLHPSGCEQILNQMIEQGVVRGEGQRYFATQPHLSLAGFGGDQFVKHYFQESMKQVSRWAEADFKSSQKLFANSVFSIDSRKPAEFKQELRELIERFAESAEDPKGDRLARLVVAFGLQG